VHRPQRGRPLLHVYEEDLLVVEIDEAQLVALGRVPGAFEQAAADVEVGLSGLVRETYWYGSYLGDGPSLDGHLCLNIGISVCNLYVYLYVLCVVCVMCVCVVALWIGIGQTIGAFAEWGYI
jgi:hypothetical protein